MPVESERLVFTAPLTCEVERAVVGEPGLGEVRLRSRLGLISPGTELAIFAKTHRGFDVPDHWAGYPFHPGYATVAVVESVGEGVDGFAPGDRVLGTAPHATVSVQPVDSLIALGDDLDDERAVFHKLLQIASTPQLLSPVRFGESVLVIGCGLVGNLAAQLCRVAGAHPVQVWERSEERMQTARRCGLDPGAPDARAAYVVEAAGSAASVRAALDAVEPDGRVIVLSSPRERVEIDPYFDIHHRGVQLVGAHEWRKSRAERQRYDAFLEALLTSERVLVDPLVSERIPFGLDAQRAYEGLLREPDDWLAVLIDYDA